MKIYLYSLLSLMVVGCSSISNTTEKSAINIPTIKTSIFTYHIDPNAESYQSLAEVKGDFVWENGCIFLKNGDNYYTPMFPDTYTKWDENSKTITLDGHIFKMGDHIDTNGGFVPYKPNTGNGIEKLGEAKCLKPVIAGIGTLGLKK